MKKNLAITLSVDAKTGEVTAVRNSFDKLDRKVKKTEYSLSSLAGKLVALGASAISIYSLARAFRFVVESGFEYNKAMDASRAKLTAMISASRGYTTVAGEQVSALQRQKLIIKETDATMQLLNQTNAETAMGMSELVDIYALAKPGMDRYHWALKDQIEIVKLASNTASNFGMSAEELQSGIDDLAAGTWEAASGFGKMMKAIGVSKAEYAAAADKVAYLKEKMRETGAAQDTWAVAVSNFQVAWDTMAGQITQPIFDGLKKQIKALTGEMKIAGPEAMQTFSDALVSMVNGGIGAISTLISWVSKLVSGFRIAFAGYKKLAGAARVWWNGTNADNMEKLNALKTELAHAKQSGIGVTIVLQKIRALKKDMKDSSAGAKLWQDADKDLGDIAEFDAAVQKLAHRIKKVKIPKGSISNPISEAIPPAITLAYKTNALANTSKKYTKALKEQARQAEKVLNLRREYYKLIGDKDKVFSIDANKKLADMMKSGAFSQEELSNAYDAMWRDFQKEGETTAKSLKKTLQDAFDIDGGTIGEKLFDNLWDSLQSFVGAFKSNDPFQVANATGELITSSLDMIMPGAGTALKMFGAIWSKTLSEAEIKAAAGRTEFGSKGTQQIVDTLRKYQAPQLTASRSMLKHLESMDNNLMAALSTSSSLDLAGRGYTPKTSSVLGGVVFASTTELIGSGIKFYDQAVKGFEEGVNADQYQAIKKTSSLFGIFTSESVKESTKELSEKMAKQIGSAFKDGIDAAMDALDTLGFDKDTIREKIEGYVISIGKVNLKDLSPEEQAKALNAALTEQLNNVVSRGIEEIASPENIQRLNGLIKANEEYVQGLVRIATEHEVVRQQLSQFGIAIEDFATSDALVQAAGGLEKFRSAMDTFVHNFFSSGEQKQFLAQQLQYALSVYNTALPASKAQFKALVLETMAKIKSVKATISTLKAEIAAKVAAGKMSLAAAYGELDAKGKIAQAHSNVIKEQVSANNLLIRSSHESSKASVAFGKSVHNTIRAMATGVANAAVDGVEQSVDAAGGIDYSRITSPAIAAAQAELKNLEGLYGTLIQNMGSFAEYYGDSANNVCDATTAAADAMDELHKRLMRIADLKLKMGADKVEIARYKLELTTKKTGLKDLTIDNALSTINAHMEQLQKVTKKATRPVNNFASSCGSVSSSCDLAASSCNTLTGEVQNNSDATQDLIADYEAQYDALKAYQEALRAQREEMHQTKLSILGIRQDWGTDTSIDQAKENLRFAIQETKMYGITAANFISKFNEAVNHGIGSEDIKKWKSISDAIRGVIDAETKLQKERDEHLKSIARDYQSLQQTSIKALLDFGMQPAKSSISSLNEALQAGDFKTATDAFNEYAKAIKEDGSKTYKQKVFDLARANNLIQSVEKKNPNADVVKGLELLRKENEALRNELKTTNLKLDAIERNTHMTKVNTDNEYLKVVGEMP